jgi:imidazole glycerol-phosphate synthase subunit HisH
MRAKKIVILDYGRGNVQSVVNGFATFGVDVVRSSRPADLDSADGIILPGVGAFGSAMLDLNKLGISDSIKLNALKGKPLLGICLGMQLLFDESDEFGITPGLGLIEGRVEKLKRKVTAKLPHVRWAPIVDQKNTWNQSRLFRSIEDGSSVYFVHSYACEVKNVDSILSTTLHGDREFCSSVKQDNIFGCQFHPEKSGPTGLKILKNFWCIVEQG